MTPINFSRGNLTIEFDEVVHLLLAVSSVAKRTCTVTDDWEDWRIARVEVDTIEKIMAMLKDRMTDPQRRQFENDLKEYADRLDMALACRTGERKEG